VVQLENFENNKTIYDLKLHECLYIKQFISSSNYYLIMRVPSGWIYKNLYTDEQSFVPYNEEFLNSADNTKGF
jgi:hypothetical protein